MFYQTFFILRKILKKLSLLALDFYQATLAVFFGGACRFEPSCSNYAKDCYGRFGFLKATNLTFKRLCKCHPLGPYGWDPAPLNAASSEALK